MADNGARQKAVGRFRSLAGSSEAEKLVDALEHAAQDQLHETITGSGPVPSSMVAARAELLYFACTRAERILEQREVEVLFRTLPATARAILATMHATYEEALRNQFLARMRQGAKIKRSGSDAEGLFWSIAFPDTTGFDAAWDEIARLDFTTDAEGDRRARTIVVPQALPDSRGDTLEKLGLQRPKVGDDSRGPRR